MKKSSKEYVLIQKITYSVMIVLVYILGRKIPVFGVDTSAYKTVSLNAQTLFLQSLTGDFKNISIFILGLWPYMIASFFAMIYMAFRSIDRNAKLSKRHLSNVTNIIMMVIAAVQAYQKVESFVYLDKYNIHIVKSVAFIELMAGMVLVIYFCDRCQKYGIGGKSAIFLVNIYDGIFSMLTQSSWSQVRLPILIGITEIILIIIFENTEKRIAVQRVSIRSIYEDKNYIAYKFNPIGIMPIMFASAFFAMTQMILNVVVTYNPGNMDVIWVSENMVLTSPLGMITYIVWIWILNIGFSFLMLLPHKTADDLMRAGDSLEGIHSGKYTTIYLSGCVLRLGICSSLAFSVFVGVPFLLQYLGYIDESVVMIPSSLMMTAGLWISFYREAEVYHHTDMYRPFITI